MDVEIPEYNVGLTRTEKFVLKMKRVFKEKRKCVFTTVGVFVAAVIIISIYIGNCVWIGLLFASIEEISTTGAFLITPILALVDTLIIAAVIAIGVICVWGSWAVILRLIQMRGKKKWVKMEDKQVKEGEDNKN